MGKLKDLLAIPAMITEKVGAIMVVLGEFSVTLARIHTLVEELNEQSMERLEQAVQERKDARNTEGRIRRLLERQAGSLAGDEGEDGAGGVWLPEEGPDLAGLSAEDQLRLFKARKRAERAGEL